MEKLKNTFLLKLKERTGGGIIKTAGTLLCLAVLMSALLEYRQAYVIASGTEEMIRKATVTMGIDNSYNAYSGAREERSNAYATYDGSRWNNIVSTTDLERQLCKLFNFKRQNGMLVNHNHDGVEFAVNITDIDYINKLTDTNELRFYVKYTLKIPLHFAGKEVTNAKINQATTAYFTPVNGG